MSRPSNLLYLWVFLAALAGGLLLTPIVGHFARRLGVVDNPSARKAHLEPVSMLGGLAIYLGAFVGAYTVAAGARSELKGLFLAGLVVVVFGIQDDISPLDPVMKSLAQVTSALVLVGFGVQVQLTRVGVVDVVLSAAWIYVLVNALNYQDNINGLTAGLSAVSSLGFFAIATTTEQYLVAVLAVGTAGGALGFLRSNYPRARVFMGDAGAMFLGLVIAFLGIRIRFLDQPSSSTFLVPALLVAVPLFDVVLVTVSRIRRGLSPSTAGTDHTSHRLVRLGLPAWAAVAVMWATQAVLCACALVVARQPVGVDAGVFGLALVAAIAGLVYFERPAVTDPLPRRDRAAA